MYRIFFIWFAFSFSISICSFAQEKRTSPSLEKLHKAVNKLVLQHYPKATSHVFEENIGFEYSTRVYVTRMISKGEAQLTTERGPMNDGVWCNIWYRKGDLEKAPAYARAEGEIKREAFKEHTYYPNDSKHKCHLMVTLRLPLKTTDKHKKFVKELHQLLNNFGKYLQ